MFFVVGSVRFAQADGSGVGVTERSTPRWLSSRDGRTVLAPAFTDIGAGLAGVFSGSATWGDYDGDGDLDALITGFINGAGTTGNTFLYRNSGGPSPTFSTIATGFPALVYSSVGWGDYNNDGNLDALLAGGDNSGFSHGDVYRNNGGASPTFSFATNVTDEFYGSVAWGDYDNDGHLDILETGMRGSSPGGRIAEVFRSSGGGAPTFAAIGAGLTKVWLSTVAWGDYDNDGNLDLVLNGVDPSNNAISGIYHNSGGASPNFTDIGAGLPAVSYGAVAWGDYDNDGDLDLVIAGNVIAGNGITNVFRNSGGALPTFTDIGAGLPGMSGTGSAAWADYDNDGNLDLLLAGGGMASVFRNSGGALPSFSDIGAGMTTVSKASAAWGDYDNDGHVDILLTGAPGPISKIYRNTVVAPANAPPAAPSGLSAVGVSGLNNPPTVSFSWNAATDDHTPATGLSYNLRVGTTPGGNQISSAMAAAGGYRRIPALGNSGERLSRTIKLPSQGVYYWSVQAIDGALAGGPFGSEQTVNATLGVGDAPAVQFSFHGGAPNPFSESSTLTYDLPRTEQVQLDVFDLAGKRVRTLVSEVETAGHHQSVWNGTDASGHPVSAGVYFYEIHAGSNQAKRRTVLLQ